MTVELGILSTAHPHSNGYATAIAEIDGAALVAVADENEKRGRKFAERHGIEYDEREAVCERVDAAVVTATNADHRAWTATAADAGLDILCEKPVATTTEDARAMVERCSEGGVELGVAMPVRFSEPARQAKIAVERGEIGELKAIVGTNILTKQADDDWLTDPERSGGGAVMDHTVHIVDLARWITGEEVTEVYAESDNRFSDLPVEDVIVASMELEGGTPLTHDGSWRQPESWDFWGDVTMTLIGTEGVFQIDCFDQTLTQTTDIGDDPGIDSVFWGSDMNEGLLRDFVSAVRSGDSPAISGREGVREVRVVEAAYESAETGDPVSLRYDDIV